MKAVTMDDDVYGLPDCAVRTSARMCDLDTAPFLIRQFPAMAELLQYSRAQRYCAVGASALSMSWARLSPDGRRVGAEVTVLDAGRLLISNSSRLVLSGDRANATQSAERPTLAPAADIECPTACGNIDILLEIRDGLATVVVNGGAAQVHPVSYTDYCNSEGWGSLSKLLDLGASTSPTGGNTSTWRPGTNSSSNAINATAKACTFRFQSCASQSFDFEMVGRMWLAGDTPSALIAALLDWRAAAGQQNAIKAGPGPLPVVVTSAAAGGAYSGESPAYNPTEMNEARELKALLMSKALLQAQAHTVRSTGSTEFAQALVRGGLSAGQPVSKLMSLLLRTSAAAAYCQAQSAVMCTAAWDAIQNSGYRDALQQTCSTMVLAEFDNCCKVAKLDYGGRGLIGRLPGTFTAAPVTIFTDNPRLCGLISKQARPGTKYALRNSNVRLSLPELAEAEPDFVLRQVHVALGTDIMAYNLQGPVRNGDAVKVCALLGRGSVQSGSFRALSNTTSCNVFTAADTAKRECLAFTTYKLGPFESSLRIDEYNTFITEFDSGLACGGDGFDERLRIVIWCWTISVCGAAALYFLQWLLVKACKRCSGRFRTADCSSCCCCCCCSSDSGEDSCFNKVVRTLRLIIKIVLFFYDEVSDWLFISEVAHYGNVRVVIIMGFLHVAKNTAIVFAWLLMAIFKAEHLQPRHKLWLILGSIVAVLQTAGVAVSVIVTKRLVSMDVFSSTIFVDTLAMQARTTFLLSSICGIVWNFCWFTVQSHHYLLRQQASGVLLVHSFVQLLGEDVAQGVAQSVMWANGGALAATKVFMLSAVGSATAISYSLCDNLVVFFTRERSASHSSGTGRGSVVPRSGASSGTPSPNRSADCEPAVNIEMTRAGESRC